jgi:hypothetical protein
MDRRDWRLVYHAVWALGVVGGKEATAQLQQIRDSYWYPPVRIAASGALDALQTGKVGASDHGWDAIKNRMLELERLTWQAAQCKRGQVLWQGKWEKPIRTSGRNAELKVESGSFTGTNHGEWGGELYFRNLTGGEVKLLEDNILGIYQTSNGTIAVAGLSHLSIDQGTVYALRASTDGNWEVSPLLTLPGRAAGLTLTSEGDLLMVAGTWAVAMRAGGKLEWLRCR